MPFLGKTPTKLLDANVNIDGGNIDGTTIGASSTAPATVSTFTSTGIDDNAASTAITIDSSQDVTFTSDVKFPDNGKAIFGAGSDLEIYHNGSNSIIKDNGTGNLLIQGATDIVLEDTSGANYFRGVSGSYVRLYHNNSTKLETTATGIEVDGTDGATAIGIRGSSTTNNTLGGLIGFGDSANALVSFIGGGRAESNDDGFLSFRTTIAGVTSEAMHIDRSGNVGIGSPAASGINAPLDVDKAPVFNNVVANFGEFIALSGYQRGVVNINGRVNGTDYDAGLSFVRRNAGNSNWLNSIIAQDDGGHLYFGTGGSAGSASTERMRIDSSGNVGIGTTSPDNKFHVVSGSAGEVAQFTGAIEARGLSIRSETNTDASAHVVFNSQSGGSKGMFTFETDGTERMRIDSSGNVGIGTDSPAGSLHVLGGNTGTSNWDNEATVSSVSINVQDRIYNAYSIRDGENIKAAGIGYSFNSSNGYKLYLGTASSTTSGLSTGLTLDGSGNVGIGTSSPNTHGIGAGRIVTSYSDSGNLYGLFTAVGAGTGGGEIDFGNQSVRHAAIASLNGSALAFYTNSTNTGVTVTERMRIDSSGNLLLGRTSTPSGIQAGSLCINFDIHHQDAAGNDRLLYDRSANLLGNTGTNVTCATLSKSSGSFKIDHPLPEKTNTHHLVHSFVEAPQADNIYRGTVDLVNGSATVNLDTAGRMSEGTFVLLNTNVQCFTTNESGWTAVKGSVSENVLTITAQEMCSDTISWLVVGERCDTHMINTDWTDESGRIITEPLKGA